MTGYVDDLSRKSGVRTIEKLDRLRSTMAVNVLSIAGGQSVTSQKTFYLQLYRCENLRSCIYTVYMIFENEHQSVI